MLLLELVVCLVNLRARIETPGASTEQILVIAALLQLVDQKIHEKDEKIDYLLHVTGLLFL